MSRKHKLEDEIPSEVLCARLYELGTAVCRGKEAIEREFTMRVPAELDRDADCVLNRAAKRIEVLEAKIKKLDRRDLLSAQIIHGNCQAMIAAESACPVCITRHDGEEGECDICGSSGYYSHDVIVSWTTIKEIYVKAVELLGI